jgi:hypothetical protein
MTTLEFSLLFLENTVLYISLWVAIFFIYRLLFWKTVKSIFDPLYFFIIFTNSICTANVIFLSLLAEIRTYYTVTYLLSECALLSGILLLSRVKPVFDSSHGSPLSVDRLRFGMILTLSIAICASLIIYAERGIPLLLESRNDASGGGTGFGFMARLSQVATALFVLFYYVKSKITGLPNSIFERMMLFASIIMGILSGYKAFFLFYLFGHFITVGYNKTHSIKKDLFAIVIGLCLMLSIFAVVNKSIDVQLVMSTLMVRLLASGDVYYMAFVNDTIDQLPRQEFFFQLFGSLLASFRLIGWDQAPLNYGYAINEIVNKNDLLFGPTFRYNVLWLLLTGSAVLTVVFSLVLGMVVGFLNRLLYQRSKLNFTFIFLAFFYYKSFILILGPDHAISDIFLSLLILIFIFLIIFLIMPYKLNRALPLTRTLA